MHHQNRSGGAEFDRKVAVGHGVKRVLGNGFKAEKLSGVFAVDRIGRTGKRGSAERAAVDAVTEVKHAFAVTFEHFDISEHMVTEGHGLSNLHVGEARHDDGGTGLGLVHQHFLEVLNAAHDFIHFAAEIETDVRRHLVVAGTTGMQTLASVADQGRQTSFDIEMNVFKFELPLKSARLNFFTNLGHTAANVREVLFGDNADLSQHGRMSQRAVDVRHSHTLVEIHAGRVAKHESVHRLREATGPGLLLGVQRVVGVIDFLSHCFSLKKDG